MRPQVDVKGIRDGILITLGEGSWDELQSALFNHLDEQAAFLHGAKLAIDVGNQVLKAVEMGHLRNEISEKGMFLWALLSTSPTTEVTAQTLGLATRLSKPRPDLTPAKIETALHEGEEAILMQRTLRSGFRVQYKGHVVVIGDVNPGAEIIASGNVVVWGRLRGLVHAGAEGDAQATVCALDLSPTQLRIAGMIAAPPQRRGKISPETAHIINGQVIAEAWEIKKSKGKEL
jgi:septum site-determining protein MinC